MFETILPHLITLAAVFLGWLLSDLSGRRNRKIQERRECRALIAELTQNGVVAAQNAKACALAGFCAEFKKNREIEWHVMDSSMLKRWFAGYDFSDPVSRLNVTDVLAAIDELNAVSISRLGSTHLNRASLAEDSVNSMFGAYRLYDCATRLVLTAQHIRIELRKDPDRVGHYEGRRKDRRAREWIAYFKWISDYLKTHRKLPHIHSMPEFWASNMDELPAVDESDDPDLPPVFELPPGSVELVASIEEHGTRKSSPPAPPKAPPAAAGLQNG